MTRHQPNTDSNLKNNTKIRPETRSEYSQTHPKPVRSGRVFRVGRVHCSVLLVRCGTAKVAV